MNHPQIEQRASPGRGTGGQPATAGERFLRISDVSILTGLAKSSIYDLQRENSFPHSVPLPGGRTAWLESEVREWMNTRIALRNANPR